MSEPERSEWERYSGEEKGLEWSKVLPLNSRRLSTAVLRKIAHAMGLPVSVTGDELRQLIKGKLIATGREPKSVQVLISMSESGEESLGLQDEAGVFVEVAAEAEAAAGAVIDGQIDAETDVMAVETTPIVGERESGSEGDEEVEELKHSLQVATEENRSLKEELTAQQIENAESLEMLERREKQMAELEQALEAAKSSSRIEELTSELE